MFNSSLNSRVFFCLHLSLLQWNWKLQMNDRDGMNWVKIAICAPLPMQTIDFYANHSHIRNTNIFKILVWFGWTFFFFRWNWSAYASIAKWQTIDLQQHIHDIFFSLTPPVVFVYHTTFFWHFLFVETIFVLWKFATEKIRILNCMPFSLHPNLLSRSSSFLEVLLLLFDIVQFGVVCVFLLFFFFFSLPLRSTQFYWETLKLFFSFSFFYT